MATDYVCLEVCLEGCIALSIALAQPEFGFLCGIACRAACDTSTYVAVNESSGPLAGERHEVGCPPLQPDDTWETGDDV